MHYELLYPSKYLKASDLRGRDFTLTIAAIEREELKRKGGGKSERKAIVYFQETAASARKKREDEKRWVMNITCARTIANIHGTDLDGWIGKRITMYTEEVDAFGEKVDAIRIRPTDPGPRQTALEQEHEPDSDDLTDDEVKDLIGA